MDLRGEKHLLTSEFTAMRIAVLKPWKSMGGGWAFTHKFEV